MTLASELGYSALADLIISKTPVEKRKLLLDYKKKVRRKNYKFIPTLPHHFPISELLDCLAVIF